MEINLRTYGNPPFSIALLHGGPGAAGGMEPLARELASRRGILEPLQTADSIDGLVDELKTVLEEHGNLPVTLVGHSWGAWLGFIFAARFPAMVRKLILVGSGGFEESSASSTLDVRLSRLGEEERGEVIRLLVNLHEHLAEQREEDFARLSEIFFRAEAFDPLPYDSPELEFNLEVYKKIWGEATNLRKSGRLLEMGRDIQCPVVAIHGDYDSHPAAEVERPLSAVVRDFRFFLLRNCGHKPWIERQARELFFAILEGELALAE
jgi:pimeloyl-ACP methyl ester carboxylesterase